MTKPVGFPRTYWRNGDSYAIVANGEVNERVRLKRRGWTKLRSDVIHTSLLKFLKTLDPGTYAISHTWSTFHAERLPDGANVERGK